MLRRLIFLRPRKCAINRFFSSNKDTDNLRKEFQKLAKEMNETTTETQSTDEIKIKDQAKMTEDLKAQFKGVKEDLSKQTGQAKTAQERLKESWQDFSMPKITMPDFSKWKNIIKPKEKPELKSEKIENEPEASKSEEKVTENTQQSTETKEEIKEEAPPKIPYYEKYPKLKNLHKAQCYIKECLRETFPDQEFKVAQLKEKAKIHKAKEEELKKWMEEHPGDENIPEWKKGALQVVEKKQTKWEKLKEKVTGSKLGSKVNESTQTILNQEGVKKAKENIQDIKEGIQSIGLDIKDSIQMSDSRIIQAGREMLSNAAVESTQAKAVKVMRAYDPDFDIYQLENDLEHIVVDFFQNFLDNNKEYVKNITDGPARELLLRNLNGKEEGEEKVVKQEVYEITRPTFLGVNLEEKQNPRFSFSCTVKYSGGAKDSKGNTKVHYQKINYFFMISRHPDPDFETYGHPWQFLVFQPAEDQLRLGS